MNCVDDNVDPFKIESRPNMGFVSFLKVTCLSQFTSRTIYHSSERVTTAKDHRHMSDGTFPWNRLSVEMTRDFRDGLESV